MAPSAQELEQLFASTNDEDLCDAIYSVLLDVESSPKGLDGCPSSWGTLWAVWGLYWMWMNEGFSCLWYADSDSLALFEQGLEAIGDEGALDFWERSVEACQALPNASNHEGGEEAVRQLASEWDAHARLSWNRIEGRLATFCRRHRKEFSSLLPLIRSALERSSSP